MLRMPSGTEQEEDRFDPYAKNGIPSRDQWKQKSMTGATKIERRTKSEKNAKAFQRTSLQSAERGMPEELFMKFRFLP